VDVLCDGRATHEFSAQVVRGIRAHGAGCMFSAAITANLALGHDLPTAVRRAKRFITRAFQNAVRVGNFRALKV
jgi:hydroxymethylpyrimidine/phosphomethylpyrimidine kinase